MVGLLDLFDINCLIRLMCDVCCAYVVWVRFAMFLVCILIDFFAFAIGLSFCGIVYRFRGFLGVCFDVCSLLFVVVWVCVFDIVWVFVCACLCLVVLCFVGLVAYWIFCA